MFGKSGLESNIWKITAYFVFNKRGFAPIVGVYLLTVPNTTAQSIGLMWMIANIVGFILEVPSGYISDKVGHKRALVVSRFLMVVSTAFYLIGGKYIFFILALSSTSAAMAFSSGTLSAFMHETLRGLGREKEYTKVMGRIRSLGFILPLPLYVGVPLLADIDFRLAIAVVFAFDIVSFLITLTLKEPEVSQEHIDEVSATNFRQVISEGFKLGFMKYLAFGAIFGSLIMAMNNYKDVYQVAVGIPIIYLGFLFASSRAMIGVLLWLSGWMKERLTLHRLLFFKMMIFVLVCAVLAFVDNPWWIAAAFIFSTVFKWGLGTVTGGFHLEIIGDSKFKATLLSVGALLGSVVQGVLAFVLGTIIAKTDYAYGYQMLLYGGSVLLLASFTYILFSSRSKMKEAPLGE